MFIFVNCFEYCFPQINTIKEINNRGKLKKYLKKKVFDKTLIEWLDVLFNDEVMSIMNEKLHCRRSLNKASP